MVSKKSHFKIGAWNTRGLGAPSGADPAAKLRALFSLMAERRWNCALLSDLRFPSNGVHEVKVGGYSWVLIHHGKVGVALDAYLAQRWRSGGAQLVQVQGWEDGVRAFGLSLPGVGWKPGFLLVPVYAPLVGRTTLVQREAFRERLGRVLERAQGKFMLVLGGDFNAEVGSSSNGSWSHVLGLYGGERRTKGGEELLMFCEQEGLVVAGSYTPQAEKATWFHNRWGTGHILDHFLVRGGDRRWVTSVKTLHFSGTQTEGTPPPLLSCAMAGTHRPRPR